MKLNPLRYRTEFEPYAKPFLEKCYYLPDWAFVSAIETVRVLRGKDGVPAPSASRWDIAAVIAGYPQDVVTAATKEYDGVPPRLILAKARQLINKGIIIGCACGCRGDFELVHKR